MRDPVLERDMFRKAEATPPSDGVVSLVKEESDYERRKKQAAELLASAKERQNPENYKTLSEQNRPGVFRPVATAQPQAPQPNTQQQMAQMQAMGFRPVGMKDGGYVKHFFEGGFNSNLPDPTNLRPAIQPPNDFGAGSIPRINLPTEKPADVLTEAASSKDVLLEAFPELAKATDEDIDRLAREELDRVNRARAKSPLGRGIQSLLTRDETDLDKIKAELRSRRAKVREAEAIKETPITPPFSLETASTADIAAQKVLREEALLRARGLPTEADREATRARMLGQTSGIAAAAGEKPKEEPKPATEPKAEPETQAETKKGIGTLAGANKPTDMESIKAARNAARQENINLALIQAGLAIAGGQSPNALTNIATGGISGIQAFQEAEKTRRAAEISDRELASKERYYGILESKAKALEGQQAERSRIAMANARLKGQQAADTAYAKWLDTTAGQMAKDDVRAAQYQTFLDAYTRAIYNDYLIGGGSSSSDPLGILASSEE